MSTNATIKKNVINGPKIALVTRHNFGSLLPSAAINEDTVRNTESLP